MAQTRGRAEAVEVRRTDGSGERPGEKERTREQVFIGKDGIIVLLFLSLSLSILCHIYCLIVSSCYIISYPVSLEIFNFQGAPALGFI